MRITEAKATPLALPYRQTFHYATAELAGAAVVLVEVRTDEGIVGYGECTGAESTGPASAETAAALIRHFPPVLVGQSPFNVEMVLRIAQRSAQLASMPRLASHVLAGLELALWDIIGKALEQPVHRLLGGAVRGEIDYFAFVQGGTPEELRQHARSLVADGYSVFYVKIGMSEEGDLASVAAIRDAIGGRRLRVDANEAWDPLTAIRMINRLSEFDIEFVEQPTAVRSIAALRQVKEAVTVPIAADQSVYSLAEVFEVCRQRAADVIVLGPHETGGLLGLRKAAAIAEAAGLSICIHGQFETGVSTCASNQIAATLPNLTDGNQIMWQLLEEDLVAAPDLTVRNGVLPVLDGPGLGFELDRDAVNRAAERFRRQAPLEPS